MILFAVNPHFKLPNGPPAGSTPMMPFTRFGRASPDDPSIGSAHGMAP